MLPRLVILFYLSFAASFADQLTESESLPPPEVTRTQETDEADDPLVKASDIIQKREEKTIGASVKKETENYDFSETLENLQAALGAEQDLSNLEMAESARSRVQEIVIAFIIELAATLLVLSIAFQIAGRPARFIQLISLSLAVALFGTILNTLMNATPLNPVRAVGGLLILAVLIRQFTEVRTWASAATIALIARIVSLALIWLIAIALTAIGSL